MEKAESVAFQMRKYVSQKYTGNLLMSKQIGLGTASGSSPLCEGGCRHSSSSSSHRCRRRPLFSQALWTPLCISAGAVRFSKTLSFYRERRR